MANKNFAVQETSRPFGPTEQAHGFTTCSEHSTLSAARKAAEKLAAAMRARCGQGAWDSHRRIIALRTQTMTETHYCCGAITDRNEFCPDWAEHRESFIWALGEPMPYRPGLWQCAKCAAREAAYEAKQEMAD